MVKLKPEGGLGVNLDSIVGGEDLSVELPWRHFIRNVLPGGPVGMTGLIHVDDELLAVSVCYLLFHYSYEVLLLLQLGPVCLVIKNGRLTWFGHTECKVSKIHGTLYGTL